MGIDNSFKNNFKLNKNCTGVTSYIDFGLSCSQ